MTQTATPTVTREPKHPGYDTLGDADNWGEKFYLLVDGERIGGTYWCPVGPTIEAGKQWVSYGPAGYSFGHATREDAEEAQLEVAGVAATPVATVHVPAAPEPEPLATAWEQALAEAKQRGVGRCGDAAAMAAFCDANIQMLCGAVSPRLVWEGAQRKGLTFLELGRLAGRDPMAVEALMWG